MDNTEKKITNNSKKLIIKKIESIINDSPKNHIVGYCADGPIFGYDPDIVQNTNKYDKK